MWKININPIFREIRTFTIVWLGQLVSLIGSGLTSFALGVWVYQTTGSVSQFAFISVFVELPAIIVAPIAGAIVDRYSRHWVMLLSDLGSGLSSAAIALLLFTNRLEIWHIYLTMAFASTCKGFQEPAYYSSTSLLVPKEHFGRASGMVQLAKAAGHLFSPILGGILIVSIKIHGIILIDFASFLFALTTLLLVKFPKVETSSQQLKQGKILDEATYGWTYIKERPGLLFLVFFFAITNFSIGIAQVLLPPLILNFASPQVLGMLLSIGGLGWLTGGIVISVWGGTKPRIYGILGFELLFGLCILIIGLQPNALLIAPAMFFGFFNIPIITASSHAIWQSKVPSELQGRVFAVQGAIAWSSFPLAYALAGPLADSIFEPLLLSNGLFSNSIGKIIGVGAGRGIALLFIIAGIVNILVTIRAYHYPRLRLVEQELPEV
jgi:MFS transporter, DHA3 family, macrolide efflux protein